MLNRTYRSRHRGFTLIELLVVIAIIAILAAILFPVFAQARESARAISCMSNVREMGLGMQQYTQDYDETMPFAFGCNPHNYNPPPMPIWQDALYPYIKVGSGNAGLKPKDNFWHCPDDSQTATATMSYGVNADVTGVCNGSIYNDPSTFSMAPASLASIQRPSSLVFCGDGSKSWHADANEFEESAVDWIRVQNGGVGNGDIAGQQSDPAVQQQFENALKIDYTDAHIGWQDATPTWSNKGPAYRHHRDGENSGFANLVYCDGHSKAARFGSLHVGNFFPGMTQDLPQQ